MCYGLVTGAVYYGVVLYWLTVFGYLPWVLVVLKETAFAVLFAVVARRMMPGAVGWCGYAAVPAAWTVSQWARSLGPVGFTWGSLAHTQANIAPIIQFSCVTGPWGIDFLLCLMSLALAEALIPGPWVRRFVPAIVVVGVSLGLWSVGCAVLTRADDEPGTKVAIIQGNVSHTGVGSESVAAAVGTYTKMSLRAAAGCPDLVIWPETVVTTEITDDGWGYALSLLARTLDANLVVGGYEAPTDPSVEESYNSAFFYDRRGRKVGVYHKVRLVPYGEFVPLRDRMKWLKRYGIRDVDVLPGASHRVIRTDAGKIGAGICFESLFSQVPRIETRRGASILVIITNDEWFKRTQAARHHLMMSKLRAVENRRYVARGAATGISAIIDPWGRTLTELGIYKRGVVTGTVSPRKGLTPYARWGDWFAYACAAVMVVGLSACRLSDRRSSKGGTPSRRPSNG